MNKPPQPAPTELARWSPVPKLESTSEQQAAPTGLARWSEMPPSPLDASEETFAPPTQVGGGGRLRRFLSSFGTWAPPSKLGGGLLAVLMLLVATASAQDTRELWVPTRHLDAALADKASAVVLTPEQYEALIRDARAAADPEDDEPAPPVASALTQAALTGTLSDEVVRIIARYEVESFTEGWAEVPLPLPRQHLGQVTIGDSATALRASKKATHLFTRGLGKHTITAEFHLPVSRSPAGNSVLLSPQNIPVVSLDLTIPTDTTLDSPTPFVIDPATPDLARFALPASASTTEIRWNSRAIARIPEAAIFQTCSYLYTIDETRVEADLGFVVTSSLAELPQTFAVTLPPDLRVLSIEGSELRSWAATGDQITLRLAEPGDTARTAADIRILAELPLDFASDTRVALPQPIVAGIHRASGTISVFGSDSIRVKNIDSGPLTVAIPDDAEGPLVNRPHYVRSLSFPVADAVEVAIAKIEDRFQAQLDTAITLRREAIELRRDLTLNVREGHVLASEIVLPLGEEFLRAEGFENPNVTITDQRLRIVWPDALTAGTPGQISIFTRRDPAGWFDLGSDSLALAFTSAEIVGAETTSGYVAAQFDESFRIETSTAEGLEPRDGRTTPVSGNLAWFRLDDYALTLDAARREPGITAVVTAYALPLQSTIEIAGQLDLVVRHTPIADIAVSFPPEVAPRVRFDSPQLAEKRLDEATGTWTLVFHEEKIGAVRVPFSLSEPFLAEAADEVGGQTFAADLPTIALPAASEVTGDWIIEANTDTELTFDAQGLDVSDSLRVPVVAGYTPQHRVIAAYQFRGSDWALRLSGTRHAREDLVTTVIDALRLDSVLSTDGGARHQARLTVRSAGAQFLSLDLPPDSALWTLTIDGRAIKPVASATGHLRIPLPADTPRAIDVKVVYQTPGDTWRGSGREALEPVRLEPGIPVVQSEWFLHLPEGYDYQKFRSNLSEEFEVVDRVLLGEAARAAGRGDWGTARLEELAADVPVEWDLPRAAGETDLEYLERRKLAYYSQPRDHTRSTAIFDDEWELPVPVTIAPDEAHAFTAAEAVELVEKSRERQLREKESEEIALLNQKLGMAMPTVDGFGVGADTAGIRSIESKLQRIILPSVEFVDTPLREALDFLQTRSVDLDVEEAEILKKGINIVFRDTNFVDETEPKITLRLSNVPLVEALRYTTDLAQLKFKAEPNAVVILPPTASTEDYFTRKFRVPPGFLASGNIGGGGAAPADPFAAAPAGEGGILERKSAHGILEDVGVVFPEGSAAIYNANDGTLTIKNTLDQLELVEAFVDSVRTADDSPASSLEITSRFVEIDAAGSVEDIAAGRLGFDWLLGEEPKLDPDAIRLPSVDFQEITLQQAVEQLEDQAGQFSADPIDIDLRDNEAAQKKVTLKLDRVSLGEALRNLTQLGGTEFTTTSTGIVIERRDRLPPEAFVTALFELPNEFFQNVDAPGNQPSASARQRLESVGIIFPAGAAAAYNFSTNRLAIRNTPDQVAMAELYYTQLAQQWVMENGEWPYAILGDVGATGGFAAHGQTAQTEPAAGFATFKNGALGLIPLDFELPESGRSYRFRGYYAPSEVTFRYVDWERQIRFAWVWIAVGGLAFWFGVAKVWGRPVFGGILGLIVLTFLPLTVSMSLSAWCNALLLGWCAALALWISWRICKRLSLIGSGVRTAATVGLLMVFAGVGHAQDSAHRVIVPYDESQSISEQSAQHYWLDRETFERLWTSAKEARTEKDEGTNEAATDSILTSALYRAQVIEDQLRVSGRLTLLTRGKAWQSIPLGLAGVNLTEIRLDGAPGSLRDGKLLVEKPGAHLVEVTFELPLPDRREDPVTFSIPQAAGSMLAIDTGGDDVAEPVVSVGGKSVPLVESDGVYAAALGGGTKIQYRERLRTTGRAMTRPNYAAIHSHLFVSPALERLEVDYRLEFAGQEENSFAIEFDESVIPVEFGIPNLESWTLGASEVPGMRRLAFTLTRPVKDALSVRFVGERLVKNAASARVYPALSAAAMRVQNTRTVLRTQDLSIALKAGARHRQADLALGGIDASGFDPVATYEVSGDEADSLTYTLSERSAERSAEMDYVFQVGEGKLETIAQCLLRSPDTPLGGISIALPGDDVAVQSVTGPRLKDWWVDGSTLTIRFFGGTPEITPLLLHLTQPLAIDAETVPIGPMELIGFSADQVAGSGLVVTHVTREAVLQLDQARSVVREIDASAVSDDFEVLPPLVKRRGLKFERGDFSGSVDLRTIAPKYDASWTMLAQIEDSRVRLSVQADIEIGRSAVREVTFSTEASVPEFRVISDEVRETTSEVIDDRRIYRVTFQRFVTDAIAFTLDADLPSSPGELVALPEVTFSEATRQERYVIVENRSRDRLSLTKHGVATAVREQLPYAPTSMKSAELFRVTDAGDWSIGTTLESLETTAGKDAVVLYADLTTVFRANGEEWLRATYRMQNRSLQFMPVEVGSAGELVSVSVDGREARADRGRVEDREVLLIPLIQTEPGQLAYDVELVYRSRDGVSEEGGKVSKITRRLEDPELVGVTVEKTLWSIFLPEGHVLKDSDGNLQPVAEQVAKTEILESQIQELRQLNQVAASDGYGGAVRRAAVENAGKMLEQLEETIEAKDNNLKQQLERQKIVLTENRIEMPVFDTESVDLDLIEAVEWDINAGEIVTRGESIEQLNRQQVGRVDQQVRLNDNISIGNGYFNNGDIAVVTEPKETSEVRQSQNFTLNQIANTSEADEKLNALNYAQIGHGGVAVQTRSDKGQKKEAAKVVPGSQAILEPYVNARSALSKPVEVSPADPFAAPAAPSAPAQMSQLGDVVVAREYDQVMTASGRRAVTIDLPVEGTAYQFKKLKSHAWIEIESHVSDSDASRWLWLGLGVVCLGSVLGVDRLRRARA